MCKIIAVIQARIGSTRLPGKVLLDLEGKTVLERVIERAKASKLVTEVVVATTIAKEDLEIVKLCACRSVSVYCGSRDDVLDRYYQIAKLLQADHVVRITADCPMIDPKIIDKIIKEHLLSKSDYTSNVVKHSFPDGEDIEIFTLAALKKVWEEGALPSEREHVTSYILNHPDLFHIKGIVSSTDLSRKRWTLDNPEDYKFIKIIYKNLCRKNNIFGMKAILGFLKRNPDIEKINRHIIRNEGYLKSLGKDKLFKNRMPLKNEKK